MEILKTTYSKDERHEIFSKWICKYLLGLKENNNFELPGRVIDVAGGKGFLSHFLVDLGIGTALVDPCAGTGRELCSSGFFDPYCQQCEDPCVSTAETGTDVASQDLLIRLEPMLVLQQTLQQALETELDLILKCVALVGLHPDEATEAIVETALAYNLPFAVVPCCVTPQLFPNRVIKRKGKGSQPQFQACAGIRVKKLGGFLEYLMEKDYRIRKTELPFNGRNTVLYMRASDYMKPTHLSVEDTSPPDFGPCAAAAKAGNLPLLQELRESGHPWNAECAQAAAWGGHLHVLRWLLEFGCPFDLTAHDAAVKAKHSDIVGWLVQVGL
mmetsp:Transcript_3405/g.4533  ORF Transcript_3405/g.4533 Transcript_3405/m.4533 type:complete len:328 (+) Transcript_3405:102-1085(+)|eukprot:CAMPEP_0198147888 /NCGR_PEP_ID=MMETSP1443-20131203/38360_1 /TAXON_ID=186043 /ORGANISM="Entomoneis sp., Strain CCMP2396" /LENGTH=327 /DNA_ID=CAMNT_0043812405 /DNA_START=82 /DNA_END=1065 /DNA_ORIENTATION=+